VKGAGFTAYKGAMKRGNAIIGICGNNATGIFGKRVLEDMKRLFFIK
jgi:hypothetical protein